MMFSGSGLTNTSSYLASVREIVDICESLSLLQRVFPDLAFPMTELFLEEVLHYTSKQICLLGKMCNGLLKDQKYYQPALYSSNITVTIIATVHF